MNHVNTSAAARCVSMSYQICTTNVELTSGNLRITKWWWQVGGNRSCREKYTDSSRLLSTKIPGSALHAQEQFGIPLLRWAESLHTARLEDAIGSSNDPVVGTSASMTNSKPDSSFELGLDSSWMLPCGHPKHFLAEFAKLFSPTAPISQFVGRLPVAPSATQVHTARSPFYQEWQCVVRVWDLLPQLFLKIESDRSNLGFSLSHCSFS